jgi:SWI/SNF-related matrix-associated actin-dependent regulator 1 of chromatin subfamily A
VITELAKHGAVYLQPPPPSAVTFGELKFDRKREQFVISAAPAVLETAKRVFPGCATRTKGEVAFKATTRAVGELNWLMLRWPLVIHEPAAYERHRQKAQAHAQRRSENANLKPAVPPASFSGQLRPFQAEGVSFLLANERTLLADDMGLGKTVEALAALAIADRWPALVVVPNPKLQTQWAEKVREFLSLRRDAALLPGDGVAHVIRTRTPYALPGCSIYIIHYGLLADWRESLLQLSPAVVVFDEVQELRHTGTSKYSAASLVAGEADLVWGLSGTPIYNYGSEIWSVLNVLEYHCLGDFDSFSREWCVGYGSKTVEKPDVLGDHLRREGLMLRRRKSDVLSELPPKRRSVVAIDKDDSLYDRMIRPAIELSRRYSQIRGWHDRGHATREIEGISRKAAGMAKAPHVAAFVKTLLEAGERVLLYSHHHAVHDTLGEELAAFAPARVTGQENERGKAAAMKAFMEGGTNLILLALRSAAGLDGLQGRGTCVVFAELDWSPAVHSQCEDRLHRIGFDNTRLCLPCYYLVSDAGMDDVMQEALGLKVGQFIGLMGDEVQTEEDSLQSMYSIEKHLRTVIERLSRDGQKSSFICEEG